MLGIINCLSSYTLLESPIKITELVQYAKSQGYQAVGITDDTYLYGIPELFKSCKQEGINPVIGMQLPYYSPIDDQRYTIGLIAKNNEAIHRLYKLSTKASQLEKPRLEDYSPLLSESFYYLASGMNSEIHRSLIDGRLEQARNAAIYLENNLPIHPFLAYPISFTKEQLATLERLQSIIQWEFIASNEISILKKEDIFLKQVMKGIQLDTPLKKVPEMEMSLISHIPSSQQFFEFYHLHQPQSLKQLESLIEHCHYEEEPKKNLLPSYPLEKGKDAQSFLKEQCLKGKEKVKAWNTTYDERLSYELRVIHEMGFDDYFLIVWDVMREARHRNILTAPGRGSAAGSLVAYLLAITEIDPLAYDLLFERFLNPSRQTMPDIDLDFPDYRRDELYEYLFDKYGNEHVARIITFGTLAAKQVMRDVTKVFGLSIPEQQEWVQAVRINAFDQKVTLKQAYEDSYALRKLVNGSENSKRLFNTALQLEGLPKNIGMHAAGVVLITDHLQDHIPLQPTDTPLQMTQWPMDISEAIGLLKMDFLGLKNLTIIDQTLKNIEKYEHKKVDITTIPLDDIACFEQFSNANTIGIFQFESKGMQKLLRKFKPHSLEELSLINAIHRPGPSLNSDDILRARNHPEHIQYLDPSLIPILSSTFGFMIYQEQVMQVAQVYAGYNLAEADNLRRAMGKKNREQMEAEREPFLSRSRQLGRDEHISNQLFNQIMAFAGYGFNKSHSIAYSLLAYRMMYLKVHHPQCFYMSLLNTVSTSSTQFINIIRAMRQQGISILAPNINKSLLGYTIQENSIQMGLGQIRGIDRQWVKEIIQLRKQYGDFQSMDQFLSLLDEKNRQEKYIIPLIEAGAFDTIDNNRRYLLHNLQAALVNASYAFDDKLKDIFTLSWEACDPFSLEEQLSLEKNRIGSYLATQPLRKTEKIRKQLGILPINEQEKEIRALVLIENVNPLKTKQGAPMAQFTVEDAQMNVWSSVMFPNEYRHCHLKNGQLAVIYGRKNTNQYGEQIIVSQLMDYHTIKRSLIHEHLYLLVPNDVQVQQQLLNILKQYSGMTPVDIVFENDKSHRLLNEYYWVSLDMHLIDELRKLIGNDHVIVK